MKKVVEIVKVEYCLEMMIFISFAFENLQILRTICPEANCQFLTGAFSEELVQRLKDNKMDVDIWSKDLTEEHVKRFLEEGIKVNVWTVDDPARAEELISWGVQYITSNILE